MTRTLGFSMEGLETLMEKLVRDHAAEWLLTSTGITYVEIGVGYGGTLSGMAQILKENPSIKRWRAVGVELPLGYSFNRDEVLRAASIKHLPLHFVDSFGRGINPRWQEITVYLCNSQLFFPLYWDEPITFALIDACHGRECVRADFQSIERFIVHGGIAMFHDYGKEQIGQEQTHCKTLDVRGACEDLFNENPSWSFIGEWIGDKKRGGANMGLFQKL
jgi:hypothetical protein